MLGIVAEWAQYHKAAVSILIIAMNQSTALNCLVLGAEKHVKKLFPSVGFVEPV